MEDLAKLLQSNGLKAKIRNGKITVKPEGLANPVLIVWDIAVSKYKVKTNDIFLSIAACFFLFAGLSSMSGDSGSNLLGFVLISVSVLSFVTVVLTELKSAQLRATIAEFNRGLST
ncbi:hypothetical protein AB4298_10035 [Shewanella sp. 10N.261.52.F9]|uniref:hypothetical protein n=1 Tax=Shewanella sp. 10N.261.52.F9 TaxID=3229684 RepID=UPI00354B16FF